MWDKIKICVEKCSVHNQPSGLNLDISNIIKMEFICMYDLKEIDENENTTLTFTNHTKNIKNLIMTIFSQLLMHF